MNIEKIRDSWNPFNILGYKVYVKGKPAEGLNVHYTEPDKCWNSLYVDKRLNNQLVVKSFDEFSQMFYKGLFICAVVDGEVRKVFKITDVDLVTDDIYPDATDVKYIRVNVGYKEYNDTDDNMRVFNYAVRISNRRPSPNDPE